ncbi:MSHA biogenesis protein MshI [Herbaspirillum sp. HC18]|nr:MSHA biogenesis protein MshI [Herbaspirillum sp. HC18]
MSQQINLFNPIFLKQKKYFSAITMVQALGIIVVGAVVLGGFSSFQLSRLGAEVAASNAQLAMVQKQWETFKAQSSGRQKSQALEDELQKAEAEVKSLERVFDVLQKGEFGDTKGYSEYLRAFSRQIVDGIWLTGFSISGAGVEMSLQGRALQPDLVPVYIGRLKREPIMQGKSFSLLEMQVPQVEQVEQATKDSAPVARRVPAKYIEFNLQSSAKATGKEQSEAVGGQGK